MTDQKRNMNPTVEARVAMVIWAHEYAFKQRGGSMDFWDSLSEERKELCQLIVEVVRKHDSQP